MSLQNSLTAKKSHLLHNLRDAIQKPWKLHDSYELSLVDLEPTKGCNLRCRMCHVSFMKEPVEYLDLSNIDFEFCRDKTVTIGSVFEPLIHPEINTLIEKLNRVNAKIILITNGHNLNKREIPALFEANLDTVTFSFDGISQATYETIRRGGNYHRTVQNIKNFISKHKPQGTKFAVNFTVMKSNLSEVAEAPKFWSQIGVDIVRFIGMVVRENDDYLLENNLFDIQIDYQNALKGAVRNIIENEIPISIANPKLIELLPKQCPDGIFYFDKSDNFSSCHHTYEFDASSPIGSNCSSPLTTARIDWNGDVFLCHSKKIGNIKKIDFLSIWTSDEANNIREHLINDNKECSSCSYFQLCINSHYLDTKAQENYFSDSFKEKHPHKWQEIKNKHKDNGQDVSENECVKPSDRNIITSECNRKISKNEMKSLKFIASETQKEIELRDQNSPTCSSVTIHRTWSPEKRPASIRNFERLIKCNSNDMNLLRFFTHSFTGYNLAFMELAANKNGMSNFVYNKEYRDNAENLISQKNFPSIQRHFEITSGLPRHLVVNPPQIFGEMGTLVDGVLVNHDTNAYQERITCLFEAGVFNFLEKIIERDGSASIIEIGSGYGALALFLKQLFPNISITLLDISESLYFAKCYLKLIRPDLSHIYGAGKVSFGLNFVPHHQRDQIDCQYDLAINTLSMSEMPETEVAYYSDKICQNWLKPEGLFFEQNQDNRHLGMVNARDIIGQYFDYGFDISPKSWSLHHGAAHLWSNKPMELNSMARKTDQYRMVKSTDGVKSVVKLLQS